MSKDYSHIKPGMYVSMEGIEPNSDLEKQIIDAFVAAGAPKQEGRDSSFPVNINTHYRHFGWMEGIGTYFKGINDPIYSGNANKKVSVSFVLNGSQKIYHKIGDIVLITSNISSHVFGIGEKVRLVRHDGYGNWHAISLVGDRGWLLAEDEFVSINDDNKLIDDAGWIEWNGGECPVGDDTIVEVEFGGEVHEGRARDFDWKHISDYTYDITRYRVVTPFVSSQAEETKAEPCKIDADITFTVTIKGQTFELTADELKELYRSIRDVEDTLHDWSLDC